MEQKEQINSCASRMFLLMLLKLLLCKHYFYCDSVKESLIFSTSNK